MNYKHLKAAEGIEGDEFPSELRYDIASKSWVVIAAGRSKRPETFQKSNDKETSDPKECPFCKEKNFKYLTDVSANGELKNPDKDLPDNWSVAAIPNKFPAFIPDDNLDERKENELYKRINAVGFHEVIVTADHNKSIGQMKKKEVREVFNIYRRRYLDLKDKKHVNYISIFHNHGKKAGASIDHPHSQLATTPLVDVDLNSALETAKEYKKEKGNCLYCDMQKWEMEKEDRIVYENDDFLVLCPFASKVAFQTIVTPKKHMAKFENISDNLLDSLADAFQTAMKKIYEGVGNPAYNYYLHTAPCDGEDHDYYHWHWTILPKTSMFAGFELGAGMEISTIKPEVAANHLKNI
ncbi:MAG: galactose-1-phosphate uridylyltransferase [Patescibacteria group bacterium]